MSTRTPSPVPCAYYRPTSIDDALRIVREIPGARFVAGGTDLLAHMHCGSSPAPPALVSLRRVPELHGVTVADTITIGALTTMSELSESDGLARCLPAVRLAATDFGSVQVRNVATVAGNLCNASPCANLPPALLVHGARVVVRGVEAERTIDMEDFLVGPGETRLDDGELVTAVVVPQPAAGTRSTFRRKTRVAMDLALVSVAVAITLDGATCKTARVAAGAVAPTPLRLVEVEELLRGRALDDEILHRAGELAAAGVAPITDVRASADYRRHMTGVLVRRALVDLLAGGADA